jgi:hypothetical protein
MTRSQRRIREIEGLSHQVALGTATVIGIGIGTSFERYLLSKAEDQLGQDQ